MDFRTGTWARAILETQRPNGSWGQFHSRVAPYKEQTTEQALRRLHILGFTREDPPVRRALAYLRDCLQGRQTIPDRREKGAGWDCYVTLMLAAAIRIFDPSDPAIRRVVDQWRRVAAETFAAGTFDEIVYRRIFTDTFGISPCVHSRYADFSCRYPSNCWPVFSTRLPELLWSGMCWTILPACTMSVTVRSGRRPPSGPNDVRARGSAPLSSCPSTRERQRGGNSGLPKPGWRGSGIRPGNGTWGPPHAMESICRCLIPGARPTCGVQTVHSVSERWWKSCGLCPEMRNRNNQC